ncbi:MAG TPA: DUF445 domain-containing protein [Vicinamibacteria bacterium]|nr:DUF445 domain-containing protein [Vicinamibacteria bacterium]
MSGSGRPRQLALAALLVAVALALAAVPVRHTWWGAWLLAIAEAAVVGGLADWFAVTALFRRPLGLPIPHTALIPANWELLAARVGALVGGRVLTREYVTQELARLDVAGLLAAGAGRVGRAEVEAATRAVVGWTAGEVSAASLADLLARGRRVLAARPLAPALATALDLAREHGWHTRLVGGLAEATASALERPEIRAALGDVVDDLLARYRARLALYPRLVVRLATMTGVVDRERLVGAAAAGARAMARDPQHPLRLLLADSLAELPARLRHERALAARLETIKTELLDSPVTARLLDEVAAALHRALDADLRRPTPELVTWLVDHLEAARRALVEDAALRRELDAWLKARATEAIARHHGRVASFVENGVRALGPEGAVRLIEEHAGDDLQFIRVNGTLVGGLAGGVIYAVHLLVSGLG